MNYWTTDNFLDPLLKVHNHSINEAKTKSLFSKVIGGIDRQIDRQKDSQTDSQYENNEA